MELSVNGIMEKKMANPIETLRGGILANNWQLVCLAYKMLTGEEIVNSSISPLITQEQIISTINGLYKTLNNYMTKTLEPILGPLDGGASWIVGSDSGTPATPTENVPSEKIGHYGNKTIGMTDKNIPIAEIKSNQEKAELVKDLKKKRPPPKKFNVVCSTCDKEFLSDMPKSESHGQKCSSCIKKIIQNKNGFDDIDDDGSDE